jgi:hypothetical protein
MIYLFNYTEYYLEHWLNKFHSAFGSENFSSLDWYFSQISLPDMLYLYIMILLYDLGLIVIFDSTIFRQLLCLCLWHPTQINNTFCLSFSGPNMMYLFNSTEWCYIKLTTDNVQQILLQASRWRVKTANYTWILIG